MYIYVFKFLKLHAWENKQIYFTLKVSIAVFPACAIANNRSINFVEIKAVIFKRYNFLHFSTVARRSFSNLSAVSGRSGSKNCDWLATI